MDPLAIAGLVLAVVVIAAFLIVVPVLCCLWCQTRKQVHILRSQVNRMEYGLLTGKTTNNVPSNVPGSTLHSPPPGSPTTDDTKQLLSSPPTASERPSGYSAVNVLGVLPDDVRTPENLEGSAIPAEQAKSLVEDYIKKTSDYEERILKKTTKEAAPTSSPPAQSKQPPVKPIPSHIPGYEDIPGFNDINPPGPGYEDIPLALSRSAPAKSTNQYEDPLDAVRNNEELLKNLKTGGSSRKDGDSSLEKKKFHLSNDGEDYTPVFDTRPSGEVPQVVQRSSVRAMSDSSPDRKPHIQDGRIVKPASTSTPETSPKLGERLDSTRKSKRASDKEVVEFNPTANKDKKKVFRVTSTKRKSHKEEESKDLPDGGDTSSSDGSPVKEKEFHVSNEQPSESYAVVNVADKKKYRAESDVLKCEGSGVPAHYRPPVVRSEVEAIAAM